MKKALIALVVALALAIPASANAASQPVVLLVNGGGWIHNPAPMTAATEEAKALGFQPVQVSYPLFDLRAANTAVRQAAAYWRQQGRQVVAYGVSAGGTMAALLAAQSRVDAAAVNAPPSDLILWDGSQFLPGYWEMIRADEATRREFSPYRYSHLRPVKVFHSRADSFVPYSLNESYDARFSKVSLVEIPGEHAEEQYARDTAQLALGWLRFRVGFDIKLRRPQLEAGR